MFIVLVGNFTFALETVDDRESAVIVEEEAAEKEGDRKMWSDFSYYHVMPLF